jgi:DNA/RNA endonuclease YhcR with UshA esterase domain
MKCMNAAQISARSCVALVTMTLVVLSLLSSNNVSFGQSVKSVDTIANSKKLPLGTAVTIEGTVTLASGTFRSSFSDYGFQVQDKSSGTYVSIKTDVHLAVGRKVRVSGKIAQTPLGFQMIETDERSVKVLAGTGHTKPIVIATGKVDDTVRGRLIKITGTVTKPIDSDAPYGFRVTIDDGTGLLLAYVSTSSGVTADRFVVGQVIQMVGIAGKFRQQPQIYPRSPGDVNAVPKPRGN